MFYNQIITFHNHLIFFVFNLFQKIFCAIDSAYFWRKGDSIFAKLHIGVFIFEISGGIGSLSILLDSIVVWIFAVPKSLLLFSYGHYSTFWIVLCSGLQRIYHSILSSLLFFFCFIKLVSYFLKDTQPLQ